MFLVATLGKGSMDLYSLRLAKHLKVPTIYTDIYQRVFERFNKPLLSPSMLEELSSTWSFARRLESIDGIPHLPNHHFGRVGLLLRKPFIITVHDLIRYFDLKGYGPLIHRPNVKDRFWLSLDYMGVKRAARIITPSRKTMEDLVRHLDIPEDRIRVVYHGVDEVFKPTKGWRPCEEPYILYVGSEHPRKNLATLLKAFSLMKREHPELRDVKLVKAGRVGGGEEPYRERTLRLIEELGLQRDVIFIDWVPQEKLAALYSQAELFAFPSIYEGFGWPPLEAMACGCPVIASNSTSLPEVLGDAAMYADPSSPEAWAEAMERVLTSDTLRRDLSRRGLERAKKFTWSRAAEQLLRVYEEVEQLYGP